ncbi:S9 family peptidase, partial [Staphylococcus aureus]|nr:S9 family peptidase [Staphylococcus aureus]
MDFTKIKKMPIDAHTHHFDEVTYKVDGLNVKALMMTP